MGNLWNKVRCCRMPLAWAVLVIVHVGLFLRYYPVSLFTRNLVPVSVDTTRYFSNLASAAGAGGLHGYDPHQMAGYPVGLWNSMGKKGFELARFILPGVPLEHVFYITLVLAGVVVPVLFFWCFSGFFATRTRKLFFAALIVLYWHFETQIAYFWQVGNVFFPGCSMLAAVFLLQTWRLCFCKVSWGGAFGMALLGSFIFYVHTVLMVPVALAAVAFAASAAVRRQLGVDRMLRIGSATVLFLLLILPWLIPLLLTRHLSEPEMPGGGGFAGGVKYMIMDFFSDRVYSHHFDRRFLFQFALILGTAGSVVVWRRQREHAPLLSLSIGAAICLLIVYGLPPTGMFKALQPYRFLIPAITMLLPLVAIGCMAFGEWFARLPRSSKPWAALPLLILLPHLTGYFLDATAKRQTATSASYQAVLERIETLPGDGRILIDEIALGHLTPEFTGRPIIGGLSTQAFLKHGFAGIDDKGILFGMPADAWTAEALADYLRLYAVQYAVLRIDALVGLATGAGDLFKPLWRVGRFHAFEFTGYDGYAMEGEASVKAEYNRISVDAQAGTSVILKFHWSDFLRCETPGVMIEPVRIQDLPVSFIRVTFPAATGCAVITHSGKWVRGE